jgi:hypothetical protein
MIPNFKAYPKSGKKKSAKSRWKSKCLRVWSEIVRAGGRCERCGAPARDAHHIIPRGTSPTMGWFDLRNGIALCFQCHSVHGPHSLDVDEQIAFRDWVRGWLARKGVDYEVLRVVCKAPGKISEYDYEVLYGLLLTQRRGHVSGKDDR